MSIIFCCKTIVSPDIILPCHKSYFWVYASIQNSKRLLSRLEIPKSGAFPRSASCSCEKEWKDIGRRDLNIFTRRKVVEINRLECQYFAPIYRRGHTRRACLLLATKVGHFIDRALLTTKARAEICELPLRLGSERTETGHRFVTTIPHENDLNTRRFLS